MSNCSSSSFHRVMTKGISFKKLVLLSHTFYVICMCTTFDIIFHFRKGLALAIKCFTYSSVLYIVECYFMVQNVWRNWQTICFLLECKIGTTAETGGKCTPCQNNTYGVKCSYTCVCQQSQRYNTCLKWITAHRHVHRKSLNS